MKSRNVKSEAGAALVEASFCIVFLVISSIGMLEFVNVLWKKSIVEDSLRRTVRNYVSIESANADEMRETFVDNMAASGVHVSEEVRAGEDFFAKENFFGAGVTVRAEMPITCNICNFFVGHEMLVTASYVAPLE